MYEIANHGVDPREQLEGTTMRIDRMEGYKYRIAKMWKDDLSKAGSYVDAVLQVLPRVNLVYYIQKQTLEDRLEREGKDKLENALTDLYEGSDDEMAFNKIVEAIGASFDILGFLFFLKDPDLYMPVRSSLFDERLQLLNVDSHLSGNCSWPQYQQFNALIAEVQTFLRDNMNPAVTLVDAHSFIWILPGLEYYLDHQAQLVEHNKFGKGIVIGFDRDLIIVKFGKEQKSFGKEAAFSKEILKLLPGVIDIYGPEDEGESNLEEEPHSEVDDCYRDYSNGIVSITKDQWIGLFENNIINSDDAEYLAKFYVSPNHSSTLKRLAVLENRHHASFISPVTSIAKRVANELSIAPIPRDGSEDGKWYPIVFLGKRLQSGLFEWKLRPELATALEEKYDYLIEAQVEQMYREEEAFAEALPVETLMSLATGIRSGPAEIYTAKTKLRRRNPLLVLAAKTRASGVCQLCGITLDYKDSQEMPYLEAHHIVPLADNGPDELNNMVALCPNCHRKMHIACKEEDIAILKQKAQEGL